MTPYAVTSASGSPGAPTVSPLADTHPWCGNVSGGGCHQPVAGGGTLVRVATSKVVAARNASTGAPVGNKSRTR